ncbi:hypothetical protein ACTJJ7_15625 [Phyllobacterium sp. 22229]
MAATVLSAFVSTTGRADEPSASDQSYSLEIAIVRKADNKILFGKAQCSRKKLCSAYLGEDLSALINFEGGKYAILINQNRDEPQVDCCFFEPLDRYAYYLYIKPGETHTKARLLHKAYNPMLAMGGHLFASAPYGAIFVKLIE